MSVRLMFVASGGEQPPALSITYEHSILSTSQKNHTIQLTRTPPQALDNRGGQIGYGARRV